MTELLAPWPDAEAVVMALLEPVAPTWQTTPPVVDEPLIQIARIGGGDDGITDNPVMAVVCYGTGDTGYDQAKGMAEQCRQLLLAAAGTGVAVTGYPDSVVIDSVVTTSPPAEQPYDNPELRRKGATFQLAFRRPF